MGPSGLFFFFLPSFFHSLLFPSLPSFLLLIFSSLKGRGEEGTCNLFGNLHVLCACTDFSGSACGKEPA